MKKQKAFRPSMSPRGFNGSADDKLRIEGLRFPRDGNWSQTPAAAAGDRTLGQVTPLHVLTMLCKYRNTKTGQCFPKMSTLARDLGVKDRRSIQRHVDKLVAAGYLVVIPRRTADGRTNTSNRFVVLFPDVPGRELSAQDEDADEEAHDPLNGAPGSGEALNAKRGVATPSVTPPATHDVAMRPGKKSDNPQKAMSPVTHESAIPATHRAGPRDTMCHSNEPTRTIPSSNEPSAEAGALTRAATATAYEHRDIGSGRPETKLDRNMQHDARQKSDAVEKLPPRLVSHLRSLSMATHIAEAEFVAVVDEWRDALVDRGAEPTAAIDSVSWEARRIVATYRAMENLRERMSKHLQPKVTE